MGRSKGLQPWDKALLAGVLGVSVMVGAQFAAEKLGELKASQADYVPVGNVAMFDEHVDWMLNQHDDMLIGRLKDLRLRYDSLPAQAKTTEREDLVVLIEARAMASFNSDFGAAFDWADGIVDPQLRGYANWLVASYGWRDFYRSVGTSGQRELLEERLPFDETYPDRYEFLDSMLSRNPGLAVVWAARDLGLPESDVHVYALSAVREVANDWRLTLLVSLRDEMGIVLFDEVVSEVHRLESSEDFSGAVWLARHYGLKRQAPSSKDRQLLVQAIDNGYFNEDRAKSGETIYIVYP